MLNESKRPSYTFNVRKPFLNLLDDVFFTIYIYEDIIRQAAIQSMDSSQVPINWFPGHMAKSRRLLSEQLQHVDLVIELCDARLPYSSRNPDLDRLVKTKNRILILNKCDLAEERATNEWIRYFKSIGMNVFAADAVRMKNREVLQKIQTATKESAERALQKGIRKTIKAMVIGVPNVGKSTFINRLRGAEIVHTGDRPGITKNQQWVHISPYLDLLDTPGMLWPRLDDQNAARRLCYIGSIKDNIVDIVYLAVSLLEELKAISPETVMDRFHLTQIELKGEELLDAACKGRGWLLKGNRYDYDRACRIILDEFRAGKLGRITFEKPLNQEGREEGNND